MNSSSSPQRGLIWKETRQLFPLVIMLLSVALLLFILRSIIGTSQISGHFVPLVLPALFAAGVGAILVGQEKETRTMDWCASLPIPPALIIVIKFVVALVGLVVMWVSCAVIGMLIGSPGILGDEAGFANVLYWFTHSLFILSCGFYTAWRMKNTFASLVALIPLAALPYFVTSIYYSWFRTDHYIPLQENYWLLTMDSAIGVVVMGWLGYRAGCNSLSPAPSELEASGPGHWLAAWRPTLSLPIPETPFRYPLSSLVWQSVHHNRLTLAALALAILLGSMATGRLVVPIDRIHPPLESVLTLESFLALVATAGALATSWLGVFVFHGDGSVQRLRFLADRGVSPTRVWIGRQLVGMSVISLAMMAYLLSNYLSLRGLVDRDVDTVPSMAMVGCFLWIIYSVSQATSQWIRILAASAFIAPILSGVAVVWLWGAASLYEAPFWLLAVSSVLPMLATWMMMRRFMDDTAKWTIWLSGVTTSGLVLGLPLLPFIVDVTTFPGISGDAHAALIAESMPFRSYSDPEPMMSRSMRLDNLHFEQPTQAGDLVSIVEAQRFLPEDYLSISGFATSNENVLSIHDFATDHDISLSADARILSQSVRYANYFRYLVSRNPDDVEAVDSLGKWIDALTTIASRLRLSDRWYDQGAADEVEIWLTQTLSMEQLKPLRSHEFSKRAIALVADQVGRTGARRRALLSSWWQQFYSDRTNLHGYNALGGFRGDSWFDRYSPQKLHWIYDRLIDRLTVDSLELLETGESGRDTLASRRKLYHLMIHPDISFATSPYSDNSATLQPVFDTQTLNYPASRWYGAWEEKAKQLAD